MAFACRHAWSAAGKYTRIGTDWNLRVASNCTFRGHKFQMKKKREKIKYRVSPSTWIPDFCIHQHYYRYITDTCTAVQDTKDKNGPNNSKKNTTHIFPKNRHDMIPHWLNDHKWFIFKKEKKTNKKELRLSINSKTQTHKEQSWFLSVSFLILYMKCWHSLSHWIYKTITHTIILSLKGFYSLFHLLFCSTQERKREKREIGMFLFLHTYSTCL